MENIVACCGCICNECPYYQKECGGAQRYRENHSGWNTREERCNIYRCCVEEKKLPHCGRCSELPCSRYDQQDPTRTPEENAAGLKRCWKYSGPWIDRLHIKQGGPNMASSLEYVQHVAAQLSGAGAIPIKNYLASMACGAGNVLWNG